MAGQGGFNFLGGKGRGETDFVEEYGGVDYVSEYRSVSSSPVALALDWWVEGFLQVESQRHVSKTCLRIYEVIYGHEKRFRGVEGLVDKASIWS